MKIIIAAICIYTKNYVKTIIDIMGIYLMLKVKIC